MTNQAGNPALPLNPSSNNLLWQMLDLDPIFNPSDAQKLHAPGVKINFNPRDVSIEMIFIVVLNNQGMNPIQEMMQQIAEDQEIQDALNGGNIDFASIISQMEQAAGSGGFKPGTSVTAFMNDLKTFFQKAFGQMTQDSQGNYVPVSGSKSSFAQFINMLKSKYGANWESNPAFQTMENMVKGIMTTSPNGGATLYNYFMGEDDSTFPQTLKTMAANYYADTNGSGNGATNFLSNLYTDSSAAQAALQGMGSENTAMLQTDAATLNSFDQTGQNAITGFNQGFNTMINNHIWHP